MLFRSLSEVPAGKQSQSEVRSWCELDIAAGVRASLAVFDDFADLVVRAQIAERQEARLGVEGKPQLQPRPALEQATAQSANAEARVKMGSTEPVAHRGNHVPNAFPLRLRKSPKGLLQLRRKLNPPCPLRYRH